MTIRLAGIIKESIVDGPGIRYTIFTQGCKHNCPGCHNPQTHDITGGYEAEIDEIIEDIKKNPLLSGITLSGGEPFLQAGECAEIAKRVNQLGLNVITYTGYTYEYIINNANENQWLELLKQTWILIDGPFLVEQKSFDLPFRGSSNQRIIDVQHSLKENIVIEAKI